MIHTFMFHKHIHKVKFYPRADDFTQALLVMLVTNIMSDLVFGFTAHKWKKETSLWSCPWSCLTAQPWLRPHPLAEIRHAQATVAPHRPTCSIPLAFASVLVVNTHTTTGDTTTLSRIAKRKHRSALPQISYHKNILCRFYNANHCRHHRKWAGTVPWHRWAEAWYFGQEKAPLWWGL